jgi:PHD/YefM family antitoxin component YafN of YafNO toxin-antitoxin module
MITLTPQFITNSKGKKTGVILPVKEFESIIEELEMQEDIRMYDEAKKRNEPSMPIDEAFKMIEAKRKKK